MRKGQSECGHSRRVKGLGDGSEVGVQEENNEKSQGAEKHLKITTIGPRERKEQDPQISKWATFLLIAFPTQSLTNTLLILPWKQ